MFLGSYDFDGDPALLMPAYDRLLERFPTGAMDLHVCVRRDDGITVFDACPSREVFDAFSTSADFRATLAAVGLPEPRVSPRGTVERLIAREMAR